MGTYVKYYHIRIAVAFIIGDGKLGDALCLRYGSHKNAKRLSRCCKVSFCKSDDPLHRCNYIIQREIDELVFQASAELPPGRSKNAEHVDA